MRMRPSCWGVQEYSSCSTRRKESPMLIEGLVPKALSLTTVQKVLQTCLRGRADPGHAHHS